LWCFRSIDEELASCTVADVLTAPDRFVGEKTLADPLEGPDYGICKAQIMRRADGLSLWIQQLWPTARYDL